jgi:hypothetical protein
MVMNVRHCCVCDDHVVEQCRDANSQSFDFSLIEWSLVSLCMPLLPTKIAGINISWFALGRTSLAMILSLIVQGHDNSQVYEAVRFCTNLSSVTAIVWMSLRVRYWPLFVPTAIRQRYVLRTMADSTAPSTA